MLVDDHHLPNHGLPGRVSPIAPALMVCANHGCLDIASRKPELLGLIERVERPTHEDRIG
jgi:hypothetical protein